VGNPALSLSNGAKAAPSKRNPAAPAKPYRKRKSGKARPRLRLLTLEDIDKRTRAAVHARSLRDNIQADLAGVGTISTLKSIAIDNVAVMTVMLADIKTRWLQGRDIDIAGELVPLMNLFNRSAGMLGLEADAKDVTPSLQSYLANREREATSTPDEGVGPGNSEVEPDTCDLTQNPTISPENSADENVQLSQSSTLENLSSENSSEPEPETIDHPRLGLLHRVDGSETFISHFENLPGGGERWSVIDAYGTVRECHIGKNTALRRARHLIEIGALK
jgi:hypothetical protein